MPPTKSPDHLLLENFLGTQFESVAEEPIKDAHFFDGAVFWNVMFNEAQQWLFFIAGLQENPLQSSILEVGIAYARLEAHSITGGGDALIITPKASDLKPGALQVTKTRGGRLSLATSLGDWPKM